MLCGELIMTDKFDFNEALKAIQSGQAISGKSLPHERGPAHGAGFLGTVTSAGSEHCRPMSTTNPGRFIKHA